MSSTAVPWPGQPRQLDREPGVGEHLGQRPHRHRAAREPVQHRAHRAAHPPATTTARTPAGSDGRRQQEYAPWPHRYPVLHRASCGRTGRMRRADRPQVRRRRRHHRTCVRDRARDDARRPQVASADSGVATPAARSTVSARFPRSPLRPRGSSMSHVRPCDRGAWRVASTARFSVAAGAGRPAARGRCCERRVQSRSHRAARRRTCTGSPGYRSRWEARMIAVVLGGWDRARSSSHRAAAALWGFEGFSKGVPEVDDPTGPRVPARRVSGRTRAPTSTAARTRAATRDPGHRTRAARSSISPASSATVASTRRSSQAAACGSPSWPELIARASQACPYVVGPAIRRLRRVIAAQRPSRGDHRHRLRAAGPRPPAVEHGLPEPIVHHQLRGSATDGLLAEIDLAYPHLQDRHRARREASI